MRKTAADAAVSFFPSTHGVPGTPRKFSRNPV